LTIKSTSHTCRRCYYFFRAYLKLVFSMPVNIQLSKISIASDDQFSPKGLN